MWLMLGCSSASASASAQAAWSRDCGGGMASASDALLVVAGSFVSEGENRALQRVHSCDVCVCESRCARGECAADSGALQQWRRHSSPPFELPAPLRIRHTAGPSARNATHTTPQTAKGRAQTRRTHAMSLLHLQGVRPPRTAACGALQSRTRIRIHRCATHDDALLPLLLPPCSHTRTSELQHIACSSTHTRDIHLKGRRQRTAAQRTAAPADPSRRRHSPRYAQPALLHRCASRHRFTSSLL